MIKLHNLDMLIIVEPKISGRRVEEALKKINMCCLKIIEAEGRSGGLWVFSRSRVHTVEVIKKGFNFIHLSIKGGGISEMLCTAVYIFSQTTRKKLCFDNIKELARGISKPWVIIGDFNEILGEVEKKGGAPLDHSRCFRFRRWLSDCGLINLEAIGPRYTWSGQDYRGFGRIYERLDRAVWNIQWRTTFSEASVINLPRVKSDHHLILLVSNSDEKINRPKYPFRFEDAWTCHKDFKAFIREKWRANGDIISKL